MGKDDASTALMEASSAKRPLLSQEEQGEEEDTYASPSASADPVQQFSFKRLLRFIGPGLLMSIAYVDPGNLESDLQTGAKTGYVLLWLMLLTTILGFLVQLQSAKLGVATGKHLAQHCREQYSLAPRLLLWVMAEVAIIGSDIQEVIGSAIAILLLTRGAVPLWAGVLITAVDAFLLLFLERFGVHILEGFFALLIGIMVASFGVMFSKAGVPFDELFYGFLVPRLPREDVPTAVALVGSLIMPHNIYLHSALVLSRRQYMTTNARKKEAVTYFGIESALSLAAAVVINLFVVSVFACGFYGREDIPEIGLQNAGEYLGETYGQATVFIWALGLLAAGQSSTMTGTYTGQFVMDGYLKLKISPWLRIVFTRSIAIVPTLFMALLYRDNNSQLDKLNQNLNLLQSIQLPFALTPLLLFTSTPAIMGKAFVTTPIISALTWGIALLVVAINAWAVAQTALEHAELKYNTPFLVMVGAAVVCYLGFLAWLIIYHHITGGRPAGVSAEPETEPEPEAEPPAPVGPPGVGPVENGNGSSGARTIVAALERLGSRKSGFDDLSAPLLHGMVLDVSTASSGDRQLSMPPPSRAGSHERAPASAENAL